MPVKPAAERYTHNIKQFAEKQEPRAYGKQTWTSKRSAQYTNTQRKLARWGKQHKTPFQLNN